MSKRSEEASLKAYPKRREGDSRGSYDSSSLSRTIYKQGYEQAEKELLNRLEIIEREYKGMSHNAESRENYIYASGLREATTRIIRLVKDDEEQTEWDGTEIAPPIDSDVCG